MSKGAKFLGHSIHPVLIVFPLGLLATAVIFEVIYYLTDRPTFAIVAYWMTIAGIIGGLIAAIFGWIDWLAIESGTRAKRIGLMHGLINSAVLVTFAIGLYFRFGTESDPPLIAFLLGIVGAGLALAGGWLGGELVERLGIGVHSGANPNAPSSLVSESAAQSSKSTP